MTVPQVSRSEPRPQKVYVWGLWIVWVASFLRVAAHAVVVYLGEAWFPPLTDSFGGLPRFPEWVVYEAIYPLFGLWICLDFTLGRGRWLRPNRWYGGFFLAVAGLNITLAVLRYGIRMSLYPDERWTGGAVLPISNLEMIGFMLILSTHYFFNGSTRPTKPWMRPPRTPGERYLTYGMAGGFFTIIAVWGAIVTAQFPYPCPC